MAGRPTRTMAPTWRQAAVCMSGFFLTLLPQHVQGHAFMMAPVSRTFYYTPVFQQAGFAEMEHCPHCMQSKGPTAVRKRAEAKTDPTELMIYGNGSWPHHDSYFRGELLPNGNYYETDAISVRHGLCGDPGQGDPEGTNKYGQDNDVYPVLETLAEGSVVEMKVVMSTYHWGHLEFFICNADDLPGGPDSPVTQSCFNKYPLDRAEDDGDASPIDPNHPGRYYVDPPCRAEETDQSKPDGTDAGDVVTARYQLPKGLTCDRCTIQMVYYTGNSCHHPGYEEFNPPSWPSECAPNKEDWITTEPGMCGGKDDKYPEEFWNCADVSITSGGSTGPSPKLKPAPAPSTPEPEPEVTEPTAEPSEMEYPPSYSSGTDRYPPSYTSMEDESMEESSTENESMKESSTENESMGESSTENESMKDDSSSTEPEPTEPEPTEPEPTTTSSSETERRTERKPERPEEETGTETDGKRAEPFSEGVDGGCSAVWKQCGGMDWDGPTCCEDGAECVGRGDFFAQCIPADP